MKRTSTRCGSSAISGAHGVPALADGGLPVEDLCRAIPEGDRDRVFDRFIRLDEARARDDGGSGLGLAIVHDIVTGHGGRVRVDRDPGLGGARFEVRLPVASDS